MRSSAEPRPPLVVIGGATATGKTGLSLRLAESLIASGLPVEIVSADSRQVYRGLDIGTAKVTAADRTRVPHHGLDVVDPDEPFTVADFAEHADRALGGVARQGALALLVGGTGLYLRAVGRGLALDALPHEPAFRARLEAELAAEGLDALLGRLDRLAPSLGRTIDRRNPRRVLRALEIAEVRGDEPRPVARGYPGRVLWLGLDLDPPTNRAWIARRAAGQFAAGLIEEAASLRERFDPALSAFSAIGYREAWAVLDGTLTRQGAIEADIRRNVAFARRQRTWFRAEPGIVWLNAAGDPFAAALERVRRFVDA